MSAKRVCTNVCFDNMEKTDHARTRSLLMDKSL